MQEQSITFAQLKNNHEQKGNFKCTVSYGYSVYLFQNAVNSAAEHKKNALFFSRNYL